jgi:RecA/RadA recombinase
VLLRERQRLVAIRGRMYGVALHLEQGDHRFECVDIVIRDQHASSVRAGRPPGRGRRRRHVHRMQRKRDDELRPHAGAGAAHFDPAVMQADQAAAERQPDPQAALGPVDGRGHL